MVTTHQNSDANCHYHLRIDWLLVASAFRLQHIWNNHIPQKLNKCFKSVQGHTVSSLLAPTYDNVCPSRTLVHLLIVIYYPILWAFLATFSAVRLRRCISFIHGCGSRGDVLLLRIALVRMLNLRLDLKSEVKIMNFENFE
jgi:hypothetical protein